MIKSLLLSASLFFMVANSVAQTLRVEERKVKNEESVEISSWTSVLDQDVDYCRDSYDAFIKEYFKTKTSKRGKTVLIAEKVQIAELSNLRIDQRAIFGTETGGTSVSFTFSPGYDVHFSTDLYDDEFAKAEEFTKNFVRYHYKRFYGGKIEDVQEVLSSKKGDVTSNEKKIERNDKSIQGYLKSGSEEGKTKSDNLKRENDSLNAANSKLRNEIDNLEEEIERYKSLLDKVAAFK